MPSNPSRRDLLTGAALSLVNPSAARVSIYGQAASSDTGLVSFFPLGTGAFTRTVQDRLRETVSALDFIPAALHPSILDFTSRVDVTPFLQRAIDAIASAGSGIIEHPAGRFKVSGLILKPGVALVGKGCPGTYGYGPGSISKTVYEASGPGWIVEAPNASANVCGVAGIDFRGSGPRVAANGIRIGSGNYWCFAMNCQFDQFAGQALAHLGVAGIVQDILVTNCLQVTPVAKTGAVQLGGSDGYAYRIETANGREAVSHASNLYVCGILVSGSTWVINSCTGEFSDVGIHVSGAYNKFIGARADLNWGHGWEIVGGSNLLTACHAHANSRAADNAYDNWVVTDVANRFGVCTSTHNTSSPLPRYSLRDTSNGHAFKNVYGDDCDWGSGFGTATFSLVSFAGACVQVPNGPRRTFAANDTTPSILGYRRWITANDTATSITNFDDPVPGQEIEIYIDDANTTFVNGVTLETASRTTRKAVQGQWYLFRYENGIWGEIAGDQALYAFVPFGPGSLAAGAATAIQTVTVAGATLGDFVQVSFSLDLAGAKLEAWVSAADTVSFYFVNQAGVDPLELGRGTVTLKVTPQ